MARLHQLAALKWLRQQDWAPVGSLYQVRMGKAALLEAFSLCTQVAVRDPASWPPVDTACL